MAAITQDDGVPDSDRVPDVDAYNAFVGSVVLEAVDLVALDAERRATGEASRTRFDLEAGFQVEGEVVHYRFSATGHLSDDLETDCGHVSASVIVTVRTPVVPDESFAERFGGTSAVMIAHPYLREAIASMAQRLGFPGVLLPIIVQQPGSPRLAAQVPGRAAAGADSSLAAAERQSTTDYRRSQPSGVARAAAASGPQELRG